MSVVTINLDDLPRSAVDLIQLIGLAATLALIDAFPSIKFPVPKGEDNNPEGAARFALLVEAIGDAPARVLVRHYGGDDLYVPSCKQAVRRARDRQIVADYGVGASVFELALKYRLSYRQIETILKTADTTPAEPSKQADLFA
ncbi:MAG: Mor transcription activator family protein [Rhodocyclaceae bacterium]|nr:Mor transcription activator family protein [Rhodocyclaceae bacterium]